MLMFKDDFDVLVTNHLFSVISIILYSLKIDFHLPLYLYPLSIHKSYFTEFL